MTEVEILITLLEEAHDNNCSEVWFPREYPEPVKTKRAEYLIETGEYYKLLVNPKFIRAIFDTEQEFHLKQIIAANNPFDYLKPYAEVFKDIQEKKTSEEKIGRSNF